LTFQSGALVFTLNLTLESQAALATGRLFYWAAKLRFLHLSRRFG
jgi:hypothetical protein